jgi:hypothetical protein
MATVPAWMLMDAYVDAVIARIQDNEDLLVPKGLAPLTVLEGDEEPNRIDKFPQVRVIPLVGEGDRITFPQGDFQEHNFSTTLIGFYQYRDIPSGLREVRKFGYNALQLFTGDNQYVQATLENGTVFGVATLENTQLRVGYRRSGDYILHAWQVTLNQIGA